VWTWTAICADAKLLCTFMIGSHCLRGAFVEDLKERLANRVQVTTDGHGAYLRAMEQVFGEDVDDGMLVKIYGKDRESERRYSPAKCLGARRGPVTGNPDPKHISTSLRGAGQPHHADAHAAVYVADKCVLDKGRASRRCGRASCHVLQFRPHPSDLEGHPGHGRWGH
jgi:hypothetical protein